MERIIKWSGISSTVLYWVCVVRMIADKIIKRDAVVLDDVLAISMFTIMIWIDRMAAFEKNLLANALSLLFWASIIFESIMTWREEIQGSANGQFATFIGLFAVWKTITAILIFISKPKTEPVVTRQ